MGDCLMAFQCADIIKEYATPHSLEYKEVNLLISARDEVYNPLYHLFGGRFVMKQIDESYGADNLLLKDESLFKFITDGYSEVYYVIPDLLFNNKYAFDFRKFSASPYSVRSRRLLTSNRHASKSIYLGLMSTTPGYSYTEPMALALALAYKIPSHKIYFPIITRWAGKEINRIDIPNQIPSNLVIQKDPIMSDSFQLLRNCEYFIGTDNGPSHLAYHFGMPRTLLDPQYNRLPWLARWREDYLESVPITSDVDSLAELVATNITVPQTTLIPRLTTLASHGTNWQQLLWMKTE